MEQHVQYAITTDGVRIAYSVTGSGPVLVYQSGYPFNHLRDQMELEVMRTLYERLAEGCTLLRFDHRGCGMSQRDRPARSTEDLLLDFDAVIGSAGVEALSLSGWGAAGGPIVSWVERNPSRVQHIALVDVAARGPVDSTRLVALTELARSDWELFTETAASVYFGWASSDGARPMARYLRDACDPSTFVDGLKWLGSDAEVEWLLDVVRRVSVPTLILRHEDTIWPTMDAVIELTAMIPGAKLVSLEGPWITTPERAIRLADAILGFIGAEPTLQRREPTSSSSQAGTAIILFADIVDSTALTERLGDTAFREKARELNTSLREFIRDSGGVPVEGPTLGDGLLATFTSARQAIEAALVCSRAGNDAGLPLHLGLHAGDVLREKDAGDRDNVYGGAVNVAARISGLSAPGEVLVSETVRSLARTSAGVGFEDRGEQELKGVGEALRVWAVVSESRSE